MSLHYCITLILFIFFYCNLNLHSSVEKIENKTIYVYAEHYGDLFAINTPSNRDDCLEPTHQLREVSRENGYNIIQVSNIENLNNFEYLIVFDIPLHLLHSLSKYPKEKLILFLWEPPSVVPQNYTKEHHRYFSRIYTWNDDLVDHLTYFKLYYPVHHPMISHLIDFKSKKLSTIIACNKNSAHPQALYNERSKLISFFESFPNDDFDLYGMGWPASKSYKGTVGRKVDCLRYYKFCFAYENIKGESGYITEKIFDCFHAGCVPIYWGASNIQQFIPKNCYISREEFANDQALYDFIKNMSEDAYLEYIKNIQQFLGSEQAKYFTTDHFISTMLNLFTSSGYRVVS